MEERRLRPTRSGLFAIELTIAVGIFTLCAALCVGLFVRAEIRSRDSADLTSAVREARSAAECFKAASGALAETQALYGGTVEGETLLAYYDSAWKLCAAPAENGFRLELKIDGAGTYAVSAALCVVRQDREETLLSWRVSALREAKP